MLSKYLLDSVASLDFSKSPKRGMKDVLAERQKQLPSPETTHEQAHRRTLVILVELFEYLPIHRRKFAPV